MMYLEELSGTLEGKRVLLRLDLNVSIVDGVPADPYRIEKVISTIDFLRKEKAQTLIISHIEGSSETLVPVFDYLRGFFPVTFSSTFFTPEAIGAILALKNGDVLLFENVRINPGEKTNDPEFAKKLAAMADIYVNDAFSVSHRPHASIVGVPQYIPHYAGPVLKEEIEHLSRVFDAQKPFVFILGGAKFSTKLPLVKKYLEKADTVFVGGALVNQIYKEMGIEVGQSLVETENFGLDTLVQDHANLLVPTDVIVQNGDTVSTKVHTALSTQDIIMDIGDDTLEMLHQKLRTAKTIVWNGPLGNYEKGFEAQTEKLATMIAEATKAGATSIVGGGDTLAAITKLNLTHTFSFVSTGGGAMLDFLVHETLPGIEALEN